MRKHPRIAVAAAAAAFALSALAAQAPRKTPELLARGKASYQTHCASCHGPRGLGDGEVAAALDPKPRNLATGKFETGTKPEQIFAMLGKGIPGTAMVSFGHLPEEERWALVHYVLELRGTKAAAK